jgi:hypothetical protein
MKAFRLGLSFAVCHFMLSAHAPTTPGKLTFSLQVHPGRMTLA